KNVAGFYSPTDLPWNDDDIMQEFCADEARYLLINSGPGSRDLAGFCLFQYSTDPDCSHEPDDQESDDRESDGEDDPIVPCLYLYQLQLHADCQRLGLGSLVLRTLESLCKKYQMACIKLTCFKQNAAALDWYLHRHGFGLDSTDPSYHLSRREAGLVSYHILSKSF
ncbi:Nitrogen permease regulator 2, partial [Kappamyces sp. JEL0829]